jgi:DNA-binding transcriptional regulator LsrR (DeoR family)
MGSSVVKTAQGPATRRMVATVAWLYHARGFRQGAIAERLKISQSRVSRMLEQAIDLGIVRTLVVLPTDEQSVLEDELESAYGLREAHVYDLGDVGDEAELISELGQLLALQLQSETMGAEVIGFTSWSRTLGEMVRTLQPLSTFTTKYVVEMLGDLGPPGLQHLAAHNTQLFADLAGAEPMFLRVPGVMPSVEVKETLLAHDGHARAALSKLDELDLALTGVGAVGVVAPLRAGDNFFTERQIAQARKLGAVGELNLRYIAEDGEPVATEFDDLVVGTTLEQLRRAERRLMVAGGPSKYRAIRAGLVGGWLNVAFTDATTARWLVDNRT